ncbi:hypothetical protein C8J56DRAFT_905825 [Mycena floridula]|nr:hypothetical protein C8J56DRAFT_905825 [Mycena floridula]
MTLNTSDTGSLSTPILSSYGPWCCVDKPDGPCHQVTIWFPHTLTMHGISLLAITREWTAERNNIYHAQTEMKMLCLQDNSGWRGDCDYNCPNPIRDVDGFSGFGLIQWGSESGTAWSEGYESWRLSRCCDNPECEHPHRSDENVPLSPGNNWDNDTGFFLFVSKSVAFCVNPTMVQPSIGLKKEPANSINKRLHVELLQDIFTWLWFPWSYAHVCSHWYEIIRRTGWAKMEVLGPRRNFRLWGAVVNRPGGPLRFVRHLEFWQCRCHLEYLEHTFLIPSLLLSLTLHGYHLDTPYEILTRFKNLQMLELGHWVDFWGEADDTMQPPTADNLTGYLSQSLVDLRLIFLTPGAIRHFSLWFASHASADRSIPPVKKLQSRSGHHAEVLFYMSPLLLAISSTLTELQIEILAGRDVAVETTDIITLHCLQKFSVKCLETMLQPLFFLIRWHGILDSLTITAASTEWHWGCLIDHEPFVAVFPFTRLSPSTTGHLLLICPCRRNHAKHIVEKYAFCAFKVTFAGEDENCADDNDCDSCDKASEMVQDTDSDSGSSDGTAPDLEDYKGANVSWTWLPCWDEMPYWHKARAEQALLTGQLQDVRWNVHEWDAQEAEEEEPRMLPHRCRLEF